MSKQKRAIELRTLIRDLILSTMQSFGDDTSSPDEVGTRIRYILMFEMP